MDDKESRAGAVNPALQQLDFYIRSPQTNPKNKPNREVFVSPDLSSNGVVKSGYTIQMNGAADGAAGYRHEAGPQDERWHRC